MEHEYVLVTSTFSSADVVYWCERCGVSQVFVDYKGEMFVHYITLDAEHANKDPGCRPPTQVAQ